MRSGDVPRLVFDPQDGSPSAPAYRERVLTSKEAWDLWGEIYALADKGGSIAASTVMQRTVAGWLIIREMALRLRVLETSGDPSMLMDLDPEQFTEPPAPHTVVMTHRDKPPVHVGDFAHWSTGALLKYDGGLPLHPAGCEYDDERLRWAWAASRIAGELGITAGTTLIPDLGSKGVDMLIDSATLTDYWPRVHELQAFENDLCDVILKMLVRGKARASIIGYLSDLLGLRRQQSVALLASIYAHVVPMLREDEDTRKEVFIARIESLVEEARDIGDHVSLRQYMRLQAKAIGVDKAVRDDIGGVHSAVFQFINQVADERDAEIAKAELVGDALPAPVEAPKPGSLLLPQPDDA